MTFSDPYLDSNQALLALSANPITSATSIADLKSYKLGAAANTTASTSSRTTIAPTTEPLNFPDNTAARTALRARCVDGIIVDLVTAFFMRDAQIDDFNTPEPEGKIVGQFGPPATPDKVGFVLQLNNPLVDLCERRARPAQVGRHAPGDPRHVDQYGRGHSVPEVAPEDPSNRMSGVAPTTPPELVGSRSSRLLGHLSQSGLLVAACQHGSVVFGVLGYLIVTSPGLAEVRGDLSSTRQIFWRPCRRSCERW